MNEIKKVDIFKEGNVRKGSGFDKLIDKDSFNEEKMKMILDKVDKYVKQEWVKIIKFFEEFDREDVDVNDK